MVLFQIDPLKAGPNVDIEANSKVLVDKCEKFLSLLINSVHLLPAYALPVSKTKILRLGQNYETH